MLKKISFAGPSITQKEIDYVVDATKNGWYETYNIHIKKLEKAVTSYLGVKFGIATQNCTLALHLATATLGLRDTDEVICTDFSWVATAYAISYTGAKPVFVDIDPDSWCIDPQAIKKAITSKTKAIMLVHSFGHPAQMDEIMDIAKEYNLRVIEDAAPSLGSEFKGQKTGTFGDIGCFSFHGAKIAVSGEGGIFVTNDEGIYKKASLLASMGRTDSKAVFWSDMLGYKYTIANLTAALALAQVERIDELVAKKREIFSWYYERLKDVQGLKIIKEKKDCKSNYCYPSILLQDSLSVSRDEVLEKLKALNIECRPGFPRMSRFPVFEARFPNHEAEKVEKWGISLPSALNLTREDADFVCDSLLEIIE
jgi:perosamine synthetase